MPGTTAYDAREDAREDWQDHREDLVDERGDRASNAQEQRTERQQSGQQQRTEAQQTRQQKNPEAQAQRDARRTEAQAAAGQSRTAGTSQEARGHSRSTDRATPGAKRHEIRCVFRLFERESRNAPPASADSAAGAARARRRTPMRRRRSTTTVALMALAGATLMTLVSCTRTAPAPSERTFATPEDAVQALVEAVKAGKLEDVVATLRTRREGARRLLRSRNRPSKSRRVHGRGRRGWQLVDQGSERKVLVVGNEGWPFPVPLAKDASGWRFDTAAGKEEVLDRRIGRNELAVIRVCRTYVAAQRLYAERGHDGQPAGLYARTFWSDPGRENGLFWPSGRGQKRSPLGDLVAHAAAEGRPLGNDGPQPSPFHGYYFKILTAQGPAAAGGAKDYVVDGRMSGGFALVAWPAQYDVTGVMTFVVNQDGIVREKDLGAGTDAAARGMTLYQPDASWTPVQ